MNKKPIVIIVCGNIGSGKTTLSKEYVKKGYIVISRDAFRYNIGAGKYIFNPKLEKAIWETEINMLYNFLWTGVNIFIDEVGITKEMRNRYLQILKTKFPYYQCICIQLPKLSMKDSVDRRMKDPHGQPDRNLWETVWNKFNEQYEKPLKKEGFDKIIRLKNE